VKRPTGRPRRRRQAPSPDRASPEDRLRLVRGAAIAGTIRRLRLDAQWSQANLAGRAQLSTSALSRFECGRSEPSLGEAFRIADALGLSPQGFVASVDADVGRLGRIVSAIEDAGRGDAGPASWSVSALGRLLSAGAETRGGAP
jgi:transcriptional regulator with XRE-family HTH domain